jgi:hypothetical protein
MEPVSLPSDLVMIETQSKAAPVYQESEEPRPARTPRPPRNRPAPVADEPLQQVETGGPSRGGSDGG